MSTVVNVLAILTCLRVVQSGDVINIIALQPGRLVSSNVSLEASDTYAVNTSTAVRSMLVCMSWFSALPVCVCSLTESGHRWREYM